MKTISRIDKAIEERSRPAYQRAAAELSMLAGLSATVLDFTMSAARVSRSAIPEAIGHWLGLETLVDDFEVVGWNKRRMLYAAGSA